MIQSTIKQYKNGPKLEDCGAQCSIVLSSDVYEFSRFSLIYSSSTLVFYFLTMI